MSLDSEKFRPLHTQKKQVLLIVEDSEEDYEMFIRAMKKTAIDCNLVHCETGEDALEKLSELDKVSEPPEKQLPNLIVLDLNLPGIDGREVLKKIKTAPKLKLIPVVVFSTSASEKDILDCYEHGANAYIVKPMNVVSLNNCIQSLLTYWLSTNISYVQVSQNS